MSNVKTININPFLFDTTNWSVERKHYPCCVMHCWNPVQKHNKLYVVGIEHVEGNVYRLYTKYGSRLHPNSLVVAEKVVHTFEWCWERYQKIVLEKLNKGYEYVNTYDYHNIVPREQHLSDAQVIDLLRHSEVLNQIIESIIEVKRAMDTRSEAEKFLADLILG